jgi:hypothetical protein
MSKAPEETIDEVLNYVKHSEKMAKIKRENIATLEQKMEAAKARYTVGGLIPTVVWFQILKIIGIMCPDTG